MFFIINFWTVSVSGKKKDRTFYSGVHRATPDFCACFLTENCKEMCRFCFKNVQISLLLIRRATQKHPLAQKWMTLHFDLQNYSKSKEIWKFIEAQIMIK